LATKTCAGTTGQANAFTTSHFISSNDGFQQGYVFGIMERMSGVMSTTDHEGNLIVDG
jgi:hypothetical protein